MPAKYRDAKTGKFLSQKTVENWKPVKDVMGPGIVKENKTYRPETSVEIEDRIINAMKDNEFLLFPEEAAHVDKKSLEALKETYDYDMSNNSDILGEVSFSEYLESVNPELLRQRSLSDKGLEDGYLGPVSDADNGVGNLSYPLKDAAKHFNNSYTQMLTSAKRAFDTIDSLEKNIDKTISKTQNDLKNQMFPSGDIPVDKNRDPRI